MCSVKRTGSRRPEKTMEELSERIEQGWRDRERFGRLFETAEAFGLWPEERYAVFLALLPELDGRFGEIFELFGGTGGRPTAQEEFRATKALLLEFKQKRAFASAAGDMQKEAEAAILVEKGFTSSLKCRPIP